MVMAEEIVYAFSMSADGGRTWQIVSTHETYAEMNEHIGRLVGSVACQYPGAVAFTVTSRDSGGITVAGGPMRWEWSPV
jgi:hypothetical protein